MQKPLVRIHETGHQDDWFHETLDFPFGTQHQGMTGSEETMALAPVARETQKRLTATLLRTRNWQKATMLDRCFTVELALGITTADGLSRACRA